MNKLSLLLIVVVLFSLSQIALGNIEVIEFQDETHLVRFTKDDIYRLMDVYKEGAYTFSRALTARKINENLCWIAVGAFGVFAVPLLIGGYFCIIGGYAPFGIVLFIGSAVAAVVGIYYIVKYCKGKKRVQYLIEHDDDDGILVKGDFYRLLDNETMIRHMANNMEGGRDSNDVSHHITSSLGYYLLLERPLGDPNIKPPESFLLGDYRLDEQAQADKFASRIRDVIDLLAAQGIGEKKRGYFVKHLGSFKVEPAPVMLDVSNNSSSYVPPTITTTNPAVPSDDNQAPSDDNQAPSDDNKAQGDAILSLNDESASSDTVNSDLNNQ